MSDVGCVVRHVRDPDRRAWTVAAIGTSPEIRDGVPTGRQVPAFEDPRAGPMVTMWSPSASGGRDYRTIWLAELTSNYEDDTP